jgi:hypothetical protein
MPSFLSPDGLFLFAPPQSEKDMAIFLNQVLPLKQQFTFSPTAEINASERTELKMFTASFLKTQSLPNSLYFV